MATSDIILRISLDGSHLQIEPSYRNEKNNFLQWMAEKNLKSINEDTLLLYFSAKSETLNAPTLWESHSMLKSILIVEDNIDITEFLKLNAFVTQKLFHYCSKPVVTFSKENITKFLTEAPDRDYLMMKVACIISIAGACNRSELLKILLDDVTDNGTFLLFNLHDWKTGLSRSFTVIYGLELYRKYINLRQKDTPHRRLFVHYHEDKCTVHSVGINTYEKIPMRIAQFLNLPKPKQYTGNSFPSTASKLLASGELDFLTNVVKESSIKFESMEVGTDLVASCSTCTTGHCDVNLGNESVN